jgi:PHD/YefM family antitoxin component YafN of YafNO toxin-antitoxin module
MPTTAKPPVQYVSDADGKPVSVIVPIELWREIESERETAYLLKSKAMRKRLLEAKARKKGMSLEEVRAQLGI